MKINSLTIFQEAERLAEGFKWHEVQIWTKRKPKGDYEFIAYVEGDYKLGMPSAVGSAETPKEAVDMVLKEADRLNPKVFLENKIQETKETLAKLEGMTISLPPWRPNRELANGSDSITVRETVEA